MPGYYTAAEVARIIGRSPDTMKRWRKEGSVVPSESTQVGTLTVHLYTDDDVQLARAFAAGQKTGPKMKDDQ